jgi:hypothetical protein
MANLITIAEDEWKKLVAEIEALFKPNKHPAVAEAAVHVKAAADAAAATVAPATPPAPTPTAAPNT